MTEDICNPFWDGTLGCEAATEAVAAPPLEGFKARKLLY